MVSVHLSDEEKFQVLLLAFILFLIASLASACLAASICPLNRWLLDRAAKKRRQQRARFERASEAPRVTSCNFAGPPPAYEVALRATRLQSLTGSLPPLNSEGGRKAPDWLQAPTFSTQKELDFGDYFHQPRDQLIGGEQQAHVCIPIASQHAGGANGAKQAPIMMRLWCRMVDPAELVARARGQLETDQRGCQSLSRQLSIPQLFGSLVNLATGKQPTVCDELSNSNQENQQVSVPNEMNSMSSSGSSELAATAVALAADHQQSQQQDQRPQLKQHQQPQQPQQQTSQPRPTNQLGTLSAACSITSRVLHMNVSSFSYVKDESLISSKKHSQLNYSQLRTKNNELLPNSSSNVCQLVISICDIENALNSSWLNQRSCALLAEHSALYVQCEILTQKSKSSRLLRPLRVLQPSQETLTVNFSVTLPAATAERTSLGGNGFGPAAAAAGTPNCCLTSSGENSFGSSNDVEVDGVDSGDVGALRANNTNWRHEPSADGKSIVVFTSVPKQVAQQQQLQQHSPFDGSNQAGCATDLIQFDSVFVSPIIKKSTIEVGFIRLRIFSQCRYVNESCLAELKLPLRQLLRSETRDNLGDVGRGMRQAEKQQADFILNRLLTNLVTASTGSPLSSLIEQISAEEREAEEREESGSGTSQSTFKLPWQNGEQGQLPNSSSFSESLFRLAQPYESEQHMGTEEQERRVELNYRRSLLVSHWLNYLVAPAYECQLVEETRGKVLIALNYLPTSNRLIFNAHRATIEDESCAAGKQLVKKLRLQSSTCYLLRILMIANGRILKRKQTSVSRKPEWDSQEPITFDLASISVEQPSFVVALVMRSSASATGSLQNLRLPNALHGNGCNWTSHLIRPECNEQQQQQRGQRGIQCVQSEPESLHQFAGANLQESCCAVCRLDLASCSAQRQQQQQQHQRRSTKSGQRELVIGHFVLAEEIWRELRAQPRKQIVRPFKMY